MYVELTPEDTLRDLQVLLLDSLSGFEFPRVNLNDYTIEVVTKKKSEVTDDDFVLGTIWHSLDIEKLSMEPEEDEDVLVENSVFNFQLTSEEIGIIAGLMLIKWTERQVNSIENTRMKYSGPDFKMTSQANHLQKLLALLEDSRKKSLHDQRLYKRRRPIQSSDPRLNGFYRSNWDIFGKGVYYDRYSN